MGWEDRPYYRERSSTPGGPLMWLLSGSVRIGTLLGIEVRVHASMFILIVLSILFPQALGGFYGSFSFLVALFTIVLLHEFGHCFASRSVGGEPRQILMTPLGGLAFVDAPRRPWATAWTVAGGPLVNVGICILCVAILMIAGGWGVIGAISWNPFHFGFRSLLELYRLTHGGQFLWWTWWVFNTSYGLLLFNLLPIFPLDGGQLLQALLWVKIGYYKSMMFGAVSGLVGSVLLFLLGLTSGSLLLAFIAVSCFMMCYQVRAGLLASGPVDLQDEVDYSASLRSAARTRRTGGLRSAWAAKAAAKSAQTERRSQAKIDAILDKVRDRGMHSLNWLERRTLQQATDRQRRKG